MYRDLFYFAESLLAASSVLALVLGIIGIADAIMLGGIIGLSLVTFNLIGE